VLIIVNTVFLCWWPIIWVGGTLLLGPWQFILAVILMASQWLLPAVFFAHRAKTSVTVISVFFARRRSFYTSRPCLTIWGFRKSNIKLQLLKRME
jgi:hypothetical protein